ncbi:MAG: hypothetical protein ACKVUS_17405 [Saprospiraceae bacterium]
MCPVPESFESVFFVTMRLRDALPDSFGQNIALHYYSKQVEFAHHPHRTAHLQQARKRLFARFDDTLDLAKYGHPYLREPMLAQILADQIHRHDRAAYELLAYSIMPSHIHLLFDIHCPLREDPPLDDLESMLCEPLRDIVGKIQNATEKPLKKAVKQLRGHIDPTTFQLHTPKGSVKLEGKFWHEQTFDFRVHDAVEFEKIVRYILQNPVKAELTEWWEDWPFSFWKK